MHHAYIDKLFWEWQQADPARLLDMGGQNVQTNTTPSGAFTSYNGDSGNTTTVRTCVADFLGGIFQAMRRVLNKSFQLRGC